MKIDRITLIESKSARLSVFLEARINDAGDLLLEGRDRGEFVEEQFGDADYEFSLQVKAEYKDTILLRLIREKFADDSEFKAWLEEKQIPNEFWSF